MISAKVAVSIRGERKVWHTNVDDINGAIALANTVMKNNDTAVETTITEFLNGRWIIRVLSKTELIFKIESE
jgi:hypothetical protein